MVSNGEFAFTNLINSRSCCIDYAPRANFLSVDEAYFAIELHYSGRFVISPDSGIPSDSAALAFGRCRNEPERQAKASA
jgi:hypothetical protein